MTHSIELKKHNNPGWNSVKNQQGFKKCNWIDYADFICTNKKPYIQGIFTHKEFSMIIKETYIEDRIRDGEININKLKYMLGFPTNKDNKRII
jgi:hypothetical protein